MKVLFSFLFSFLFFSFLEKSLIFIYEHLIMISVVDSSKDVTPRSRIEKMRRSTHKVGSLLRWSWVLNLALPSY
jgi:hypothetical protein